MKKMITVIIAVALVLSLVGCAQTQNAADKSAEMIAEVESLISSIGEVTLDSGNAIINAEAAYNNLDEEQKAELANYTVLQEARVRYNELIELQPAQEFAAKLLASFAIGFKNPLSLKVNNVWYYTEFERHYFTYELEATNGLGNRLTLFYGNDVLGYRDMSDQEIESATYEFCNGFNSYIVENGIKAMQNGVELDAQYIHEYLLMNYDE